MAGDKTRWDEVSAMLENIGSNNGRIEDMRDGYALLGQLYRARLAARQSTVLAGQQHGALRSAAQMWIGRAAQWQLVIDRWDTTHTLAPAAEVGLPEAAAK